MNIRRAVKRTAQAISLTLVFPAAALSGFGRLQPVYMLFAQSYALVPGIFGIYFFF